MFIVTEYAALRSWTENVQLFGYNPRINFVTFFHKLNLAIFTAKVNGFKVFCVGNFYSFMPIPLKFYMCFRSWSVDVYIVWKKSLDYFLPLF